MARWQPGPGATTHVNRVVGLPSDATPLSRREQGMRAPATQLRSCGKSRRRPREALDWFARAVCLTRTGRLKNPLQAHRKA
jgi:hypothetical protein